MSKRIELKPGEQFFTVQPHRWERGFCTTTSLGSFASLSSGLGLCAYLAGGLPITQMLSLPPGGVMLKKSGLLRNRRGHRSIPLDQIYLYGVDGASVTHGMVQRMGNAVTATAFTQNIRWVDLDLLDGKTVRIVVPRTNVFFARLQDAMSANPLRHDTEWAGVCDVGQQTPVLRPRTRILQCATRWGSERQRGGFPIIGSFRRF